MEQKNVPSTYVVPIIGAKSQYSLPEVSYREFMSNFAEGVDGLPARPPHQLGSAWNRLIDMAFTDAHKATLPGVVIAKSPVISAGVTARLFRIHPPVTSNNVPWRPREVDNLRVPNLLRLTDYVDGLIDYPMNDKARATRISKLTLKNVSPAIFQIWKDISDVYMPLTDE